VVEYIWLKGPQASGKSTWWREKYKNHRVVDLPTGYFNPELEHANVVIVYGYEESQRSTLKKLLDIVAGNNLVIHTKGKPEKIIPNPIKVVIQDGGDKSWILPSKVIEFPVPGSQRRSSVEL
jgi:hypothetical protein